MSNRTANIVAGLLAGFGWFSGAGAFFLYWQWKETAPAALDVARGFVAPMNDHGAIFYLTKLQSFAFHGLLFGGLGLFFLAIGIAPKTNIRGYRTPLSIGWRADPDDPSRVRYWAMAGGGVLAVLAVAAIRAAV